MLLLGRAPEGRTAQLGGANCGLPSPGAGLRRERKSLEQHRQLVRVNLDACDVEPDRRRKSEAATLEPFVQDRESAARPHQHLCLGFPTVDEDEDVTRKWIALQHAPNLVGQALEGLAQVGRRRGDMDSHGTRQ